MRPAAGRTQATVLRGLVDESGVELFHDSNREAWATIPMGNHKETHKVKKRGFRLWAQGLFYESQNKAIGSAALQDGLGAIAAKAIFKAPEHKVHVRLAEHDGCYYLDLADEQWQAVEVSRDGWRIISDPPVKFCRPKGTEPLPAPVKGGKIADLRKHVNVLTDEDFILMVAWLVAALRPVGPYPVLACAGEQGAAKSTAQKALRRLIDPNECDLRSPPADVRDVMIAGTNGWCIALDNLSHIPQWLSDCLCRLASGGGFATRELYSDANETIFSAQRPILLNGIPTLSEAPDLADRTIGITLPQIELSDRITERRFWRRFNEAHPRLLGALLNAIVVGLRNLESVKLDRLPRMADFAEWIVACEPALPWEPGRFMGAYSGNRENANELVLEASVIAPILRAWLDSIDGSWVGTATDLLELLTERAGEKITKRKGWPTRANVLSGMLRRIAPNLRAAGVSIDFDAREEGTKRRLIRLGGIAPKDCCATEAGSAPPCATQNTLFDPKNADGGAGNDGNDDLATRSSDEPPELNRADHTAEHTPFLPNLNPDRATRLRQQAAVFQATDPEAAAALWAEADAIDQQGVTP